MKNVNCIYLKDTTCTLPAIWLNGGRCVDIVNNNDTCEYRAPFQKPINVRKGDPSRAEENSSKKFDPVVPEYRNAVIASDKTPEPILMLRILRDHDVTKDVLGYIKISDSGMNFKLKTPVEEKDLFKIFGGAGIRLTKYEMHGEIPMFDEGEICEFSLCQTPLKPTPPLLREKYIEERFERYFQMGKHKSDGRVNVTSATGGDFMLEPDQAAQLIKERDALLDQLIKLAQALNEVSPEKYNEVWYGAKPQ